MAAQRTDDFGRYYAEGTYRAFYVDHLLSGRSRQAPSEKVAA